MRSASVEAKPKVRERGFRRRRRRPPLKLLVTLLALINQHVCLAATATHQRTIPARLEAQLKSNHQLYSRSLRTTTSQSGAGAAGGPAGQQRADATKPPGGCPPAASGPAGAVAAAAELQGSLGGLADNKNGSNESLLEFGAPPDEAASFGFSQPAASDFVKPLFYTLRLKLDPTKRKFTGQLMISVEIAPPTLEQFQQQQANSTNDQADPDGQPIGRDKNGELGYRYLTLHAGSHIRLKKAFYVYSARGSVQIPATKVGKSVENELLTLDYYPNVITGGQGLLLLVYSGAVNETDSHGLFFHHSQRLRRPTASSVAAARASAGSGAGAPEPASSPGAGLATQMQPNFARRLLPAWDEPHLKARFSLIVVLPFKNYVTLSNMAQKRKSISLSCSGEPLQEIEFHTTPTMSTYLLTLVIGRLDYIEAVTPNNLKVRAYVYSNLTLSSETGSQQQIASEVNARRASAMLALDTAVRTFDLLESSLGVKFPLAKYDMVALRDFDNGGMENWGLTLFRESYFLYDSNSSHSDIQLTGGRARSRKIEVPLVIAHEIAHQWFGNLVTARAWTYLWLNEGFAQLLMYDVANSLFPTHDYWLLFIEDIRQSAMVDDELITSSRALEFEISNPAEQITLFDRITYNKGAMIVRMLQSLLGRDQFTAALRHYLLKHSYDSVTSRDLWVALEESTGRADHQLETLMRPWLGQEGFPLVSVQVEEDASSFRLRLSQERFTLLRAEEVRKLNGNDTSAADWSIPILIASELEPTPSDDLSGYSPVSRRISNGFILTQRASTLTLPKATFGNWLKLNFNATGYFRVHYDSSANSPAGSGPISGSKAYAQVDMLQRLQQAVKRKLLSPVDRFNLIDDLFAIVKSGRRSSAYYMRYLIETFDEETEIIVFRSISEALKRLRAIVSNSDIKLNSLFDIYVQEYLRRVSNAVTRQRIELTKDDADAGNEDTHQRQAPAAGIPQKQLQLQRLKEMEDLISASRVQHNDREFVRRAADLFTRNFRPNLIQQSPGSSKAQPLTGANLLESMDRELRASIYLGALMASSNSDLDLPPEFSIGEQLKFARLWPAATSASGGAPAAAASALDPLIGAQSSSISSLLAGSEPAANATGNFNGNFSQTNDVFLRLLRAYESSESTSGEKFAICAALGSINQPQKQLKLLELTLFEGYFRPADSVVLLEAMARTRLGRQLIWEQLTRNSKLIERRQLLNMLLKSLSAGLIEPNQQPPTTTAAESGAPEAKQQIVEGALRSLYQSYASDYGKPIGQLMESVRINSAWFRRDHDGLLQYLTMFGSTLPTADTGRAK